MIITIKKLKSLRKIIIFVSSNATKNTTISERSISISNKHAENKTSVFAKDGVHKLKYHYNVRPKISIKYTISKDIVFFFFFFFFFFFQ